MRLNNKTVIVTGGARDIGKAVSLKLAAEGANVAINYFGSEEGAKATLAEIEAAGGRALILKGDMTSAATFRRWSTRP
jgi:3-oxoacyl-[acyl-carrier protein] reductase